MKWHLDGDHIFIVRDNFVDLMESAYLYTHMDTEIGCIIMEKGLLDIPFGEFRDIHRRLKDGECGEL